jgi:hypothetical protein
MKTNKNLQEKSKEGVTYFILLIGSVMIILGIIIGFKSFPDHAGSAFLLCGMGTIITFIANYLNHGYFKFFN